MKKIFLTSGLVLCMACPAFATASWSGATSGQQTNGCTQPNLGVTEGSTQLDAIWTAKTYDVIYNKGAHAATGVEDYTDEDGATYDQDYTVLTATTTGVEAEDGYTFIGYSTDAEPTVTRDTGTGAVNTGTVSHPWTDQEPWAFTADQTVYAAYLANQYTVSYACGTNATGTIADQVVTYDDAFTANDGSSCVWAGHEFTGWDCGNDTLPADGSEWNIAGSVSCTATWDANEIGITWNVNGGTAGATAGDTSCTYGGSVTLPATPTKTGYDFGGWEVHTTPTTPSQGD